MPGKKKKTAPRTKKKTTKRVKEELINVSVRLSVPEYDALKAYADQRLWPLGTALRHMVRKEAMWQPLLRPIVPKDSR